VLLKDDFFFFFFFFFFFLPKMMDCGPSFVCTSGVLHWGALNNVISSVLDGPSSLYDVPPSARPPELEPWNYRVRAKKGEWTTHTVHIRTGPRTIVHHCGSDYEAVVRKTVSLPGKELLRAHFTPEEDVRSDVQYVGRRGHGWWSKKPSDTKSFAVNCRGPMVGTTCFA
jgi:hypothetical protein